MEARAEAARREAEHAAALQSRAGKKGLFAALDRAALSVSHAVVKTCTEAQHAATKMVAREFDEAALRRWRSNFSPDAAEQLLGDFRCRAANSSTPSWFDGWVQVSCVRLMFVSDPLPKTSQRLTFYLPLEDIVSIQKGTVAKTAEGGLLLTPLPPSPGVFPQAVMVYTRDCVVHAFYDFHSLRVSKDQCAADALNTLDFAWRRRVVVPNPAYRYLDPGAPLPATMVRGAAPSLGGAFSPDRAAAPPPPGAPPQAGMCVAPAAVPMGVPLGVPLGVPVVPISAGPQLGTPVGMGAPMPGAGGCAPPLPGGCGGGKEPPPMPPPIGAPCGAAPPPCGAPPPGLYPPPPAGYTPGGPC